MTTMTTIARRESGAGLREPAGTNRYPGTCDICGCYIRRGEGLLERCMADTGCLTHHDRDGWHVSCRDTEDCEARVAEQEAREREEAERSRALSQLAREAELAGEPVRIVLWDARSYSISGSRSSLAHYESGWKATDDAVFWRDPKPVWDGSGGWDYRTFRLTDEQAARARELGIK